MFQRGGAALLARYALRHPDLVCCATHIVLATSLPKPLIGSSNVARNGTAMRLDQTSRQGSARSRAAEPWTLVFAVDTVLRVQR
jgi:hypothetical protein